MHFNSHAHVERDLRKNKLYYKHKNFNTNAHVERDDIRSFVSTAYTHFNSHAHVERDEREVLFSLRRRDFNSHAHVERDYTTWHSVYSMDISTHTLTWSVTVSAINSHSSDEFQLTRSRGA